MVDRFSRHRFSRNPDLVENFAVTNHFYSIKIQYSRKFDLVDYFFCCSPYYLLCTWMKKCCSETPHRRLLFTICWLVTSEHISETVSGPSNCSHCDILFRKSHCNSIIMSEKKGTGLVLLKSLTLLKLQRKVDFQLKMSWRSMAFLIWRKLI